MHRIIIFIILATSLGMLNAQQSVFIVIHGTWASDTTWSKPGGDFFDALEQSAAALNAHVTSFTWSGKLDNASRTHAGRSLAKLIGSYPSNTHIYLVAHSHGGNVASVASQELGKLPGTKARIHAVYALATPVNTTAYMPDMNVIECVYNLFSLDDMVQPVLGIFGRTYPAHPRIANIRVLVDGKGIDHEVLHSSCIGEWLPYIHELLAHTKCGNFDLFACGKPGLINFMSNGDIPHYSVDTQQTALLAANERIVQHLAWVLTRRRL